MVWLPGHEWIDELSRKPVRGGGTSTLELFTGHCDLRSHMVSLVEAATTLTEFALREFYGEDGKLSIH